MILHCSWAYSEVGAGLPRSASLHSVVVGRELQAGGVGKDWNGTTMPRRFAVVLCNHFTLGQFLRGVNNAMFSPTNPNPSPTVVSNLMGDLDPRGQADGTFRVATVRSTLRSTPRSAVTLSGNVTSCYGGLGRPYTFDSYSTGCETRHSLTLSPGGLKNVCGASGAHGVCAAEGMNTRFALFRHRRGYTTKNHLLTIILTTAPLTERHAATAEISPHLAWTVVMDADEKLVAENRAYLPAVAVAVAQEEQPLRARPTQWSFEVHGEGSEPIFVERLEDVEHVRTFGNQTTRQWLSLSLGGDYLLGYRIVRGSMPVSGGMSQGYCWIYSNGTLTCRYGSFTTDECPAPGSGLGEPR